MKSEINDDNAQAPILSICIPTYNRGEKLYKNVINFLSCDNQDFEIIISDNKSTDNTKDLMLSIKDLRFKFICNDENIGSFNNTDKVYKKANGKYIMLVMDKDNFINNNIDTLTKFLRENEFAVGALTIDYNASFKTNTFTNIIDKVSQFCFNFRHPSGFIFNNNLFKENNVIEEIKNLDSVVQAYHVDFIAVALAQYGAITQIDLPFIKCNYPPFDNIKHSYTYSNENKNLYFTPEFKFKVYEVFIEFLLSKIELKLSDRYKLIKKITKILYLNCVYTYRSVLENNDICDWYNLSKEFVDTEKKKNLKKEFLCNLLKVKKFPSNIEKIGIILSFIIKQLKER